MLDILSIYIFNDLYLIIIIIYYIYYVYTYVYMLYILSIYLYMNTFISLFVNNAQFGCIINYVYAYAFVTKYFVIIKRKLLNYLTYISYYG